MGQTSGTRPPESVDIGIVGAGIGGLAAAAALRNAGLNAYVFERTPQLREVGGSVVIREPSVQLFDRWGVGDGFRQASVAVDEIFEYGLTGELVRTSLADVMGDGQAYSAHRADLHQLLLDLLPEEQLFLGREAESVRNEDGRAVVRFVDGAEVAAQLWIGADGIKSVTRPLVAPADDELIFAHLVVLRGLAPATSLPAGIGNDRINVWTHDERLLMGLPLRGGDQVALDTVVQADNPPENLWNNEVPVEKLLEGYQDFYQPLLDLIKAGTQPILASPVNEREPLSTWSNGRVTLLGDAAHPMAPRQGQGANQAILDAGALAEALGRFGLDDLDAALAAYEDARIELATKMQLASRENPELRSSEQAGAVAPA